MALPQLPARRGLLASRSLRSAFVLCALGLVGGCGAKMGDVSGTVRYKDKEVTSGTVTFIAADGVPRQTEISEDGSYKIEKVPAGEAKILVHSPPLEAKFNPRPVPKRLDPETGKPFDTGGRGGDDYPPSTEKQKKTWRELPFLYGDISRSTLRYTVTGGANTHHIKLD